jgi:hypothetical protein
LTGGDDIFKKAPNLTQDKPNETTLNKFQMKEFKSVLRFGILGFKF